MRNCLEAPAWQSRQSQEVDDKLREKYCPQHNSLQCPMRARNLQKRWKLIVKLPKFHMEPVLFCAISKFNVQKTIFKTQRLGVAQWVGR